MFDEDDDDETVLLKKILFYGSLIFAIGIGAYFLIRLFFWLLGLLGRTITNT